MVDVARIIEAQLDTNGVLTKLVVEQEDHTQHVLPVASGVGVGDTLYLQTSGSPAVVLDGTNNDLFVGGGEVDWLLDGGESLSWDNVTKEIVVLQTGLYDGYHGMDWNEALDASPPSLGQFLVSGTDVSLVALAPPAVVGDRGRYARAGIPALLQAGSRWKICARRYSTTDVLTVNYAEVKIARIA